MATKQRLEVTVKETVDFMYDMLVQHPDGTMFTAYTLGKSASTVVSVLVQRGIIERKKIVSKNGMKFKYRWVATSAPTKVLYGSITQELRDKQRAYASLHYAKKKALLDTVGYAEDAPSVAVGTEPVKITEGIDIEQPIFHEGLKHDTGSVPTFNPLSIYGIDELVSELRLRGCTIENNKIVLVKRVEYAL